MTVDQIPITVNTLKAPLLEEYKSLKAESREYLRLQNRIALLLPFLFCAASTLALVDGRGIAALLIFPWLSALLVLAWEQQDYRRMQINSYISDQLEPDLDLYWSAYHKMFEKTLHRSFTLFQPGLRVSLSALALSVQWLFILLDLLAAALLIGLLLFSTAARQLPLTVLILGFSANILLLLLKYWLMIVYPWENKIPLVETRATTIVKETNREAYSRCLQKLQHQAVEIVIPPVTQSLCYFSSMYEQLFFVEQGALEVKDGAASPQQRLENRKDYVQICETGDIVRIPPGFNYIIFNPSPEQSAIIKHRRILIPELLIR